MADIAITAANVKLVSGSTQSFLAGAVVAAGQIVFKEDSTKKVKLGDNDSATAEVRSALGIALNGGTVDQPVAVAQNGAVVDVGAVLVAGTDYYLSGTPGSICPRADVVTTDDPIRIGMALTTSRLQLDINDPNVTL